MCSLNSVAQVFVVCTREQIDEKKPYHPRMAQQSMLFFHHTNVFLPTCWSKFSDHWIMCSSQWKFSLIYVWNDVSLKKHTQISLVCTGGKSRGITGISVTVTRRKQLQDFFHCEGSSAHVRNCGPISCSCTASIQTLGTKV